MNATDQSTQALCRAAGAGNLTALRRALAGGAVIDAERKSDKKRAIQIAAERGHGEIVRALHAAGARLVGLWKATGSAAVVVAELEKAEAEKEKAKIVEYYEANPMSAHALVARFAQIEAERPELERALEEARRAQSEARRAADEAGRAAEAAWEAEEAIQNKIRDGKTTMICCHERFEIARRRVEAEALRGAGIDPAAPAQAPKARRL